VYKVKDVGGVFWGESKVKPLVTLADENGGKAAIVKDDGCLVLLLNTGDCYKPTPWWFKEAVKAIPKGW